MSVMYGCHCVYNNVNDETTSQMWNASLECTGTRRAIPYGHIKSHSISRALMVFVVYQLHTHEPIR